MVTIQLNKWKVLDYEVFCEITLAIIVIVIGYLGIVNSLASCSFK